MLIMVYNFKSAATARSEHRNSKFGFSGCYVTFHGNSVNLKTFLCRLLNERVFNHIPGKNDCPQCENISKQKSKTTYSPKFPYTPC